MLRIKKMTVAVMLLIMTVSLSGCDILGVIPDFFEELFNPGLIIIRGMKIVSGEGAEYVIPKGSTIKFKGTVLGSGQGEIYITNGAKLIAQGTADEPIIFGEEIPKHAGLIKFGTSASTGSVIEYCKIMDTPIKMLNSTKIQYCKIIQSNIYLYGAISPVIQYNDFEGGTSVADTAKIVSQNGENYYNLSPIIQYCNFTNNNGKAIYFYEGETPTIEYNNITNCEDYAIWNSSDYNYTVSNNYISDCNEMTGVDTTGEQCFRITYSSYSTTPIADAGCQWE